MSSSRRVFLKSLSRSSLVLSLESVLGLATPRWLRASAESGRKTDPKLTHSEANELGVSFLNVARESGLNTKTIFGGEHKNKYLLERYSFRRRRSRENKIAFRASSLAAPPQRQFPLSRYESHRLRDRKTFLPDHSANVSRPIRFLPLIPVRSVPAYHCWKCSWSRCALRPLTFDLRS